MPRTKESKVLSIQQIEKQIFELEGVRVVIRLPAFLGTVQNHGLGYDYKRALGDNRTVAHLWFRIRRVFGETVPFVIVLGNGSVIEATQGGGRLSVLMSTIRDTYA